MPDKTFADGNVRVRYPSTVDVLHGAVRERSVRDEAAVPRAEVIALVKDSGFDIVTELEVVPARERGVGDDDSPVTLDVEVLPGQDAVVLSERAGLWNWHMPQAGPRVRGTQPATATFEIAAQDRGFGAVVLRFGSALGDVTIKALEATARPGLVHMRGVELTSWRRVASLDDIELPASRSARILLFIHGTFANTTGAFGTLSNGPGLGFLTEALEEYDAVIGFDHPTLSVDPLANARDLFARLATPGAHAPQVDIISHSRGGLVARSLVERVIPEAGWAGAVESVVFVGVPNGGTHFVDRDRWKTFADLYTNLLLSTAAALGGGLANAVAAGPIRGVGTLVKYLAAHAARGGVPGLEAMAPGGRFLTELNGTQPGQPRPGTPWFVIGSDFHVTTDDSPVGFPKSFTLWLAERAVDDVLDDANDLVVDTLSMAAIDTPPGGYVQDGLPFGVNAVVHHLNYFVQPEVPDALGFWLIHRGDRFIGAEAAPSIDDTAHIDVDVPSPRVVRGGGGVPAPRDRGPRRSGLDRGAPPPPAAPTVPAHVGAEMAAELAVAEPARCE
jgi:hypothetical protein